MRVAPDGSLERSNIWHSDPSLVPLLAESMERLDENGASIKQVLKTGEPLLFHGLTPSATTTIPSSLPNEMMELAIAASCVS